MVDDKEVEVEVQQEEVDYEIEEAPPPSEGRNNRLRRIGTTPGEQPSPLDCGGGLNITPFASA